MIKRYFQTAKKRKYYLVIICLFVIYCGLLDHLFEASFDQFAWPSNDIDNFKFPGFTILPKCTFNHNNRQKLQIIVKSSVNNGESREAIRQTWGIENLNDNVEISTVFIVGKKQDMNNSKTHLKEETNINQDIIMIDAIDSYRNNTYKLLASIDYAHTSHENCPTPDFVLLIDDDYMLHIKNLVRLIRRKNPNDTLYEGFVFNTSPFRFKFHKHRISLTEYPFNKYPPYVTAGAVLLSRRSVNLLRSVIPRSKMFPFDDVYTGIIAKSSGITPTHNDNFVFWSREITKEEWKEGVIAAHGYRRMKMIEEFTKIYH